VATERRTTAKEFIEAIAAAKNPIRSLSSAVRVAVCGHFQAAAPRLAFVDPDSRFAFRVERPRRKRQSRAAPNNQVAGSSPARSSA